MPAGSPPTRTSSTWLDARVATSIGRAGLDGAGVGSHLHSRLPDRFCGVAVDPSFLYWEPERGQGGRPRPGWRRRHPGRVRSQPHDERRRRAVSPSTRSSSSGATRDATDFIGRANINGGSPNPALIPGPPNPCQLAAAPSNKITVNSVTKNKKKGTATINAKVPGPGQVTLNQTNTPPDVNATAAGVKQVGLTITQASSFKLAVKPIGKTAKKLSKQIKKQLRKKHKAKAKAKRDRLHPLRPGRRGRRAEHPAGQGHPGQAGRRRRSSRQVASSTCLGRRARCSLARRAGDC